MLNRHRNCRTLTARDIAARLKAAGVSNPFQESLWLIAHAVGRTHAQILAGDEFSPDEERRVDAVISRRIAGEPLQYILGAADFCGRDFAVGPGVLISRHDTETLIEGVKGCFARDDSFRFADWGTGSGCIAVTILLEFPNASGVAVDVSGEALSYARENAGYWGVDGRLETGGHVSGEFDLIVSNPPYIPSGEIAGLPCDVRDYEPNLALDGGVDGMTCYREIFALAGKVLRPGGYIILEAGDMSQVHALANWGEPFAFDCAIMDAGNFPRCIVIRRI